MADLAMPAGQPATNTTPPPKYLCAIHPGCDHDPDRRHSFYPNPAAEQSAEPLLIRVTGTPDEVAKAAALIRRVMPDIEFDEPKPSRTAGMHRQYARVTQLPAAPVDHTPRCMHCGSGHTDERPLLSLGRQLYACLPVCPPELRGGAR